MTTTLNRGQIFRITALLFVFASGFVFGKAYSQFSDQFPEIEYLGTAVTRHASLPQQFADSMPKGLEKINAERVRDSLIKKVYGASRSLQPAAWRLISAERFSETYATARTFEAFYRQLFERFQLSIMEIEGSHEELRGYTWKSLLIRHGGSSANRLFVFHHGHIGSPFGFASTNTVISRMIEKGHDVLVLAMPATAWNTIQNVRVKTWDGWGYLSGLHNQNHAVFEMIDAGAGHYIRYFLEPIFSSLDAAFIDRRYRDVTMLGHSGGGWSTTLAAAMDVRIKFSISYAGTLPFFARHTIQDMGDAEQYASAFYRDFPYTLLYELASSPEPGGRTHYQVFNSDDSCCFGRSSWPTLKKYYEARKMPSEWDFRIAIVGNDVHAMVPEAVFEILAEIDRTPDS